MRKGVRVVLLFLIGVLSTAIFGVVTALMSALSLAATTALIVPGTGTPNANVVDDYMSNFWDRYIAGTDPAEPAECTDATDCTLTGINYPASFFPLVIFPGWCEPGRCETWNTSVGEGVTNLNGELINPLTTTGDDIVIAGYSQGGAVVSNELRNLANLSPELKERLKVFMIGNAYNPDGGIFTRLGFLPTIPFIDVTFGPAMPIDTGIELTGVGFEFDPVMYAPRYWGNPLAMLNAFAAFDNVHGFYLTPNGNGPTDSIAYGYTEEELAAILATDCPGPHCRVDEEGNRYFMIPAKSLPMMDLILSTAGPLAPFVKPIVDLTSPAVEVLINLGYDWSGDPGQTRYLSILPFSPTTNWFQVGIDLVEAVGEGIENVFGGGSVMIAPPATSDADVAALSASAVETESGEQTPPADQQKAAIVAQDTEVVVDEVAEENDVVEESDGSKTDEAKDDEAKDDEAKDDEAKDDEAKDDEAKDDETKTGTGDSTESNDNDNDNDNDSDSDSDNDNDSDNDSDSGQAAA